MKSTYNFRRFLKSGFSVILVAVILGQGLVYVGLGIYYQLNRQYIAKQLCVNRNKPPMHCNGRCYLRAQLQKARAGENKSAQLIKVSEEMIAFNSTNRDGGNILQWILICILPNHRHFAVLHIPLSCPDQPPQFILLTA
jgi:hypothetical protein